MSMERLRNIILEDKDILEVLNSSDDYHVLYHLSPMRENVVEWMEFKPDGELLEIGAECGALTGLFAQRVDKVVAIEWDKDMLEIAKLRHSTLDNVDFRYGDMDVIEASERFDHIVSIGTLLRDIPADDNDRVVSCLKDIKFHLKDGGQFICGVSNRYGLSSFNGFRTDGSKALSYGQLKDALYKAGYSEVFYYYPMPNHIFAREIFSEDRLPGEGELRDTTADYIHDKYVMFSEENAFDEVCGSGDFPYFANSFLIVAM